MNTTSVQAKYELSLPIFTRRDLDTPSWILIGLHPYLYLHLYPFLYLHQSSHRLSAKTFNYAGRQNSHERPETNRKA